MRSKHATWKPVPYTGLHKREQRAAAVLHTNGGGSGSMFGWFSGNANGNHGALNKHVGAHFQVMRNGQAEQYVDTDFVIYHAYDASEWAVGIETEDDGHPDTPWSPEQLATIIAICHELGVPGRLLEETPSGGVGWHEQYPSWNKSAHSCPGKTREQQIRSRVIPALLAKPKPAKKAPAPLTPAQRSAISRLIALLRRFLARGK